MAIATTAPRRIDRRLLALAESSGVLFHRSGTEQLEHWATLGAAVETVLGLPTVAKFKMLGRTPNIDSLIARVGTPAANRKLAQFLEKQVFPQYGVVPAESEKVVTYVKSPSKSSGRRNRMALAVKGTGR
jgi:ParD-like antitoxin of type II bacterial toxin-antitoxin system